MEHPNMGPAANAHMNGETEDLIFKYKYLDFPSKFFFL